MADIEVQLLGPVVALVGNRPVDLPSAKQRALLACLALRTGERVSVDRLIDDLWGASPPATARHALQVHVSNLRKLLDASAVATERPGYVLRIPRDACDATRFESLAAEGRQALYDGDPRRAASLLSDALGLWRGPALADVAFEPFAPQEAARLEELRVAATEDRIVADLELGRHTELIGELESLVAQHPLRERLLAQLMLALYRAGRQVDALRTYQGFRDRLREELGLDPGPDLQRLETAILRHDAELAIPHLAAERRTTEARAPAAVEERPETRRTATILVAGLTGLDNVARRLDPEDLRALLDRCSAKLAAVVDSYGGTVDTAIGGELIAVFGAPAAHEDDPERAVRAAHDLRRAVKEDPDEFAGVAVSVGVATGPVLFAAAGPPESRRFTVIGDVVNEARRLQVQGPADGVIVGHATFAATRLVLGYEELGGGAFLLSDVRAEKAARPLAHTPFIGREAELALLVDIWRRTIEERRVHLVSVLGEPGVGKSRQLAEFHRLATGDGLVVAGRCVPYGQSLSYAPLADAVRQAAGSSPDDPPNAARSKLDEVVRSTDLPDRDATEIARHVALLTGLDDERDRAGAVADERTLHVSTRRFFEALAGSSPLCIVVEDIHWADDALLDLVQAITRRAKGVPLMVLTFARPELVDRRPDWGAGVPGFTSLSLEPLDEIATRTLVDELGRAHGIAGEVLSAITERSGGNPLFAEELVATVAEGEAPSTVPASLTSLLLARVDALPTPQQSALRCASVIGMTFWPSAVEALEDEAASSRDGEPLSETIADLENRDLIHLDPSAALSGEVAYTFKHVLIRDAAYESLPKARRSELHRAADEWLSGAAGDRLSEFSEQLAHHALSSGRPERALEYLVTAAESASRVASHRRETVLLERALDVARSLRQPAFTSELHARRGKAFSRLALWADARAELEAALEGLPDRTATALRRLADIHNDLSVACFWLLDTPGIRKEAEAALELARRAGAREHELAARAQLTSADSADGEVEIVIERGREVIDDARKWGVDPPYERLTTFGLQLYLTGDWTAAVEVSKHTVRAARERGDPQAVLLAMSHFGMAASSAGMFDEAIATFDDARRFAEEYELVLSLPRCIAVSAGFRLDLFDYEGAEAVQEEALELGRRYFNPSAVSAGIDLLFNFTRRGEVGRTEAFIDDLGEQVSKGGGWHGWLWRIRFMQLQAEIALAKGDFEQAIELGREAMQQTIVKRRAKYEALAHVTVGRALVAKGMKAHGMDELRSGVAIAERLRYPALHAMAAAAFLDVEPDEAIASGGRAAVQRVLDGLSDPRLRRRFEHSEPVRSLST